MKNDEWTRAWNCFCISYYNFNVFLFWEITLKCKRMRDDKCVKEKSFVFWTWNHVQNGWYSYNICKFVSLRSKACLATLFTIFFVLNHTVSDVDPQIIFFFFNFILTTLEYLVCKFCYFLHLLPVLQWQCFSQHIWIQIPSCRWGKSDLWLFSSAKPFHSLQFQHKLCVLICFVRVCVQVYFVLVNIKLYRFSRMIA